MMATSKIRDQRHFEFRLEHEIFDYGIAEHIGNAALIVYFALCHHTHDNNRCFPSISHLIAECNLDNQTIDSSIQTLKQHHLIEIIPHPQGDTYLINSVRDAIQKNDWPKLNIADTPYEEPRQKETEIFSDLEQPPVLGPITWKNHYPLSNIPPKHIATKDCPYCNERGLIKIVDKDNGYFRYYPCDHETETIKILIAGKNVKIESAKKGYKDPEENLYKRPSNLIVI